MFNFNGVSAKCSLANSVYNKVQKFKMNFPYCRLILLDHTTINNKYSYFKNILSMVSHKKKKILGFKVKFFE